VLPPRPAGALAALRGNPTADVIFAAHTGLGLAAYPGEIWRDMPVGRTLRQHMWLVSASQRPSDPEQQVGWLGDMWKLIDRWVDTHQNPDVRSGFCDPNPKPTKVLTGLSQLTVNQRLKGFDELSHQAVIRPLAGSRRLVRVAVRQRTEASRLVRRSGLLDGGTEGNQLLTAVNGGVLIVLLAVIGVTIISLTPLLWVHLFVGMVLIGPVVLKLASTGYRFACYYTASPRYRDKGPPPLPLRLIAPVVVVTTVVVFASGVALLFAGPGSRAGLLPLHKIAFIVWIAFTAIYVLAHLPAVLRALRVEYVTSVVPRDEVRGRAGRLVALIGSLGAGIVLAILVIPQFTPWLVAHRVGH
jgi:hypothetical protein